MHEHKTCGNINHHKTFSSHISTWCSPQFPSSLSSPCQALIPYHVLSGRLSHCFLSLQIPFKAMASHLIVVPTQLWKTYPLHVKQVQLQFLYTSIYIICHFISFLFISFHSMSFHFISLSFHFHHLGTFKTSSWCGISCYNTLNKPPRPVPWAATCCSARRRAAQARRACRLLGAQQIIFLKVQSS